MLFYADIIIKLFLCIFLFNVKGREDPSEVVRRNVYETLYHVTRTREGVDACNRAGVPQTFVLAVEQEEDPELKVILLKALLNIVGR